MDTAQSHTQTLVQNTPHYEAYAATKVGSYTLAGIGAHRWRQCRCPSCAPYAVRQGGCCSIPALTRLLRGVRSRWRCGTIAFEFPIRASTLLDVPGWCPARPRTRRATRLRLVSVFCQGWVRLLVALLRQGPLPVGRFVPEPWPVVPPLVEEVCELALAMPEAA